MNRLRRKYRLYIVSAHFILAHNTSEPDARSTFISILAEYRILQNSQEADMLLSDNDNIFAFFQIIYISTR